MKLIHVISAALLAAAAVSAGPPARSVEPDAGTLPVWVFFERGKRPPACPAVSPRAYLRTARRGAPDSPVLVPPDQALIDRIAPFVVRIRHRSSYFNAVSAEVHPGDIPRLLSVPGVVRISPVRTFRRERAGPGSAPVDAGAGRASGRVSLADPYGPSYGQLAMIEAAELLEAGYNGSGSEGSTEQLLIGILDTGFLLGHEAFSHLDVQAQYDFVQDDTITANETGDDPQQDRHGTLVLGVIAGRLPGSLAGPAWGARYLLAKTEIVGEEIQIEEDNWVAGIEWCDQLGADIVTSSLGYIDWYTPDSLDGNTALCTKAADIAASRGIVVCNSAGNYGYNGETSIIAPADGDSVIAVGGVYSDRSLWYSSSRGPTADGRIKPDLVAQSVGVVSVEWPATTGIAGYSGTSFSAPLVAGLCAQLLEVHPDWTPMQLLDSLRVHATHATAPDNGYGWGIPRGLVTAGFVEPGPAGPLTVSDPYPNPFTASVGFDLRAERLALLDVRVYDVRGALVRRLVTDELFILDDTIEWDGRTDSGGEVPSGVYFVEFDSPLARWTFTVVRIR